ncbi:MAG: RDD family protein [Candidatus Thiodiazotropha sp. (ex Monitilora ramsayi)]|nr:RDD family protein [Candidatus Thiodiazotropha sp. (ex Monitilora ramsayi)]
MGVTGINLYFLHSRSQTIGKWVMNIHILRSNGAHAGFSRQLFLRYLLPGLIVSIPYLGQLMLLLDFATLFGPERRTLHDRLADTGVFLYPKTVSD